MAPSNSQSARPSLLRYIAMVILALIILVGIAVLITWLVLRPKNLVYSVEDAAIHNFNLTDANHLNSNFEFTIRAYNPNRRVSLYYDSVEVSVRYEDQTLATNAVQPFYQGHKNVTRLQVRLAAQTVALFGNVPKDLKLERTSGDIELDVWIKAKIRFKVGKWKSDHRTMKIFCSSVLVKFNRSKTFQRTPCHVEL
ncbi:hypothetical protein HN51_057727 [Arachis hypogaea]|uniref:Late embryogenesis abundant protein LEA-2 subgroup domain-containing protein n=2 Tax=Arachis TaxID=3817 RepID=A0A445BB47_ARAHY|nr:uncharacterized protein At1g08160 [Arachis duranensis]XP_016179611.1 uncharacterized protein At1g08160 [Arachis ipaensis]XP_025622144.1 uncharacterized protein At1g08160 [Arachis hypogaea]XP_025681229.1 uncharacterized protein At1g08160 [Arachis hypogaea]XP_057738944.1 uncharacterized protein At1g08160-like [Arachis stenosperma]QHO14952.1 uncharacterized protein DS421_10g290680 [Arachis hypogaea]RYQ82337.1 hypothetical protein Ahy_B10g100924 [Arachis hypogaea]RYR35897.1 hypothetical prote